MRIEDAFLGVTVALLGLVLVYLFRVAVGPTVFDRILGVSALGTTTTIILLLVGVLYDRIELFVDLSLAYALLSFVGALAAARYFEQTGDR
ncbi:MAG: pH regulation protein F [Candidatus Rokubacteria bacterium]|nr:pH regulation protein F [Candidatus Rokubacteria bacterium]